MSYVTGEDPNAFARQMYRKITRYNSTDTGHFTGMNAFPVTAPSRGVSVAVWRKPCIPVRCSLPQGETAFLGILLEREAFNAMPATATADMWCHQYVQIANQIYAGSIPEHSVPFNSNSGEANIFGLEPNFGGCTATFNQAWPKFAFAAIMESDGGLAVQTLAPSSAETVLQGVPVRVKGLSEYPFRDLRVRPGWTGKCPGRGLITP